MRVTHDCPSERQSPRESGISLTASRPLASNSQNDSTSGAPGKQPDRPITAMGSSVAPPCGCGVARNGANPGSVLSAAVDPSAASMLLDIASWDRSLSVAANARAARLLL